MTTKEFLEAEATDFPTDHDPETCGLCYTQKIHKEVAKEMLKAGDTGEGAIHRWGTECRKRWQESKFYKLWQEEKAAGRDPEKAFKEKGWEP